MMMSNVNRQRKLIRIAPLNCEEVARSQPRISEFLSDNANKDKTRPSAPICPDAEKPSNLSPQVEKIPLPKDSMISISEAEGTAKVACRLWNRTPPHLLLWSLRIQEIPWKLPVVLRWSGEGLLCSSLCRWSSSVVHWCWHALDQRYGPESNKFCCKLGFGTRAAV